MYNSFLIKSECDELNIADFYSTYKDLIILLLSIVIVIILLFIITKTTNKVSKTRLNQNVNNSKYVPEIYVESGDAAEKLRYFTYRKFRAKINFRLNRL